jgi:hypothetical protein
VSLKETWRPLALLLLIGLVAGVLNVLFYVYVMSGLTDGKDDVAVSTYVINLFVGWVFFSAWFLARADDELKKVEEAIHKGDKETFLVEAPKQIALSIRILYLLICVLVILSFHLFNLQSTLITAEIQFGVGFLVVVTALFLWDLDEPIGGAVGVHGVPEEWLQELRAQKRKDLAVDLATIRAEAESAETEAGG